MDGTLGEATAREGYILCFLCFKIREVKLNSDRLTCGVVHDGKGFLCVFHDSIFKVIKGFDSPSRHSYFLSITFERMTGKRICTCTEYPYKRNMLLLSRHRKEQADSSIWTEAAMIK